MRGILLVGGMSSPVRPVPSQVVRPGGRKTVSFALPLERGKGAGASLNCSEIAMILKKYPTLSRVAPDMSRPNPPLSQRPPYPVPSKWSSAYKAEDADSAGGASGSGGERFGVDEPIFDVPSNKISPFLGDFKRPDSPVHSSSSGRLISPLVQNLRADDMPPPMPAWHGTHMRAGEAPQPLELDSGQSSSGFASLRGVASRAGSWTASIARDFAHGVRSSYGFVRSGLSAGWATARWGLAAIAENIHAVSGAALMRILDMALLIVGRRSIESGEMGASISSTGGVVAGDKEIAPK